ncbi:hypothetical protein N2152v2_001131 [Parachlorella kessleri]
MTTQSQLDTLEYFASQDPMTGPSGSFAPAYARVAVSFGFTLLSLLFFAQGVHKDTDLPLREEIIVMTERCSLYFTLGLRSIYGFIAFVWWWLGTTPLLVSSVTVILLLFLSDQVPARSEDAQPKGMEKYANKYNGSGFGNNEQGVQADGTSPRPAGATA